MSIDIVWIYSSIVFLIGCKLGYHGDECSKKCDHCENNATCGAKTGACDALGCSDKRYQPRFCTSKMCLSFNIYRRFYAPLSVHRT